MNKRLDELRESMTKGYGCMQAKYINIGFDEAIAEIMPRVDELITALRTIEVPVKNIYSTDDIKQLKHIIGSHQTLATVTLTEWREFMGEG